ncbi:MAG TPA: FecR family protein [Polyangia bacterium]|nr:FecR family protein [Polyangia bacterium]
MTHLQFPLKEMLRDPTEEPTLRRIWERIDGRLPDARRRRRRVAVGALAFAGAVVIALVAIGRRDAGPLRFGDGRALVAVDAPAAGVRLALSDGSAIELGGGARFEPLESSGTTFLGVLQRGNASFDVRPGGPRRWQVECGLATVEVVGTRFSCERAPGRLRVSVQRGAIVVRGERIADRARRLAAGESLDIVEGLVSSPLPPVTGAGAAFREKSGADLAEPGLDETSRAAPPPASWRELAHRGHPAEAFAVLGAQGVEREARRLGVSDLLVLADVARLSGHPAEAVGPLERILSDFAGDPQAPLAAFALGRLELDALDRPRSATMALERALALGVPRSLREDVRARLFEAHERAGEWSAARSAAEAYLRDFPAGRRRAEMESALAPNDRGR